MRAVLLPPRVPARGTPTAAPRQRPRRAGEAAAAQVLGAAAVLRLALPLALVAAYCLTRFVHLGLLPMVSDEGTYISWGERALHARGVEDWLASLEDGKQPLLAWLMPPFLAAFPDRLVAGRVVSVLAGFANLVLVRILGCRLFGDAAGWTAAALYVAAPIALIHDRMALYDSLVSTTSLLVLWGALAWADRPSRARTVLLGLAMGAALLTKLSALFFIALVLPAIALWRPAALRQWWRLVQTFFLAAAVYSVLYLSPIVGNIGDGNFQRYSLTAGEVLALPFALWWKNAVFVWEVAGAYLGWPLAVLCVAALLSGALGGGRAGRVALLWTAVPLVLFVLTAKLIYSRYVVFCFVAALLPAAHLLVSSARLAGRRHLGRFVPWLLGAAAVAPSIPFAAALLTDPAAAPWMDDPRYITDRFQYVESNYAGYGLRDVVDYLRAAAAGQPIVVATRDSTGMPRDGVWAYLLGWPNVQLSLVPESQSIVQRLEEQPDHAFQLAAQGADLYYVLTDAPGGDQERRFVALNPQAVPLLDIPKPGDHSRFRLYQVHWDAGNSVTFLNPSPRLGGQVLLRGFRLSATSARPGDTLHLTLIWEATRRPARDYSVFTHLEDLSASKIWGQKDSQPVDGREPTSRWRPGDSIADRYDIPISPDAPPGTYDLLTGMYELKSLQRLPVDQGGASTDSVVLGRITVTAP